MRQWLYKQGEKERIFEANEVETALKNGWVDTPEKFKKPPVKRIQKKLPEKD